MIRFWKQFAALSVVGLFVAATPAWSQSFEDDGVYEYERGDRAGAIDEDVLVIEESDGDYATDEVVIPTDSQPTRRSERSNFTVELGGSFSNYTSNLGDALDGGGGWEVRGILGASSPIALELAYFGSANGFAAIDENAIATAGEVMGRINLLRDSAIRPFVAGGVDYYRIDSSGDINLLGNANETLGFPISAGLNFYPSENFTVGARGTYRILTEILHDNFPSGNNWTAGLTVGAAF